MQAIRLKLEAYINNYLALWDFYGVIRIMHKGELIFERANGYASLEFDIKNNMNSCFSLASITKQFTAFSIMILYDKALLDLDKPANLYLPPHLHIDESITVHHLLSHTSGLYNYYNFDDDFFGCYNRLEYNQFEYFNQYINQKPTNRPDTLFDYNNSNYNLLTWIIEHVSGHTFANYVRDNIFLPLNMINSVVDDGCKPIKNRSSNYVRDFDSFIKVPYHNEKFSIGAGAIVSNCDDLYKWYTCLRDRNIVSEHTYTRFCSVNKNKYCYGLEHHNIYGTHKYSHGGDHLGVSTYMQNYFDEDICIIILSNNEDSNQYKMGDEISNILFQVDVDFPKKYDEFSMSGSEILNYCGTYVKDKIEIEMIKGKLYYKRFKGNLRIEIYPVAEDLFVRRYYDQQQPYCITKNESGKMTFFGYEKQDLI